MSRTPPGQTRNEVLKFVTKRLLSGDPPTVREVQRFFGFRAVQTARQHLEALVGEGRLEVERGKSRGYRMPGVRQLAPIMVPILGRVQAGDLSLAIEDLEGYVPVEGRRGAELFALRVRGESMIEAGILPDDIVIVRAHMSGAGYGGAILGGTVEDGILPAEVLLEFAPSLETQAPLPDGCAF